MLFAPPPISPDVASIISSIIGVVGAVVGGLIGILGTRLYQRPQKKINWDILSNIPVAHTNEEELIKILFKGKPVDNVRLVLIRISNTGRVAIKAEDYIKPITFDFQGRILSSELVGIEPRGSANRYITISSNKNILEIDKLPLNPKEEIIISIIIIGASDPKTIDSIKVSGRILNGQIIGKKR